MFINTTNKVDSIQTGRKIYDSRYDKKEEVKIIKQTKLVYINKEMIENLIKLYKMNKIVYCDVVTVNSTYNGIITSMDESCITVTNEISNVINLEDIVTIKIDTIN